MIMPRHREKDHKHYPSYIPNTVRPTKTKFVLLVLGFFMCHICWPRTERLTETNIPWFLRTMARNLFAVLEWRSDIFSGSGISKDFQNEVCLVSRLCRASVGVLCQENGVCGSNAFVVCLFFVCLFCETSDVQRDRKLGGVLKGCCSIGFW